jgi:hypothetical protein
MISLENILEELVNKIPITEVGKAVFYWGVSEDLSQFIKVYGESSYPLIWLVSDYDKPLKGGAYYRDAEIVICTRETRTELLNTERIKEGYSFNNVLIPLWKALEREISLSNLSWTNDPAEILKAPNYSVNQKYEVQEIWDAMKIKVRITFTDENKC